MSTAVNKHWATDNPITEGKNNSSNQIILSSIESSLFRIKNKLSIVKDDTNEDSTKREINFSSYNSEDHNDNFELPNFNTNFLIQEGNKNYSAKSQRWLGYVEEVNNDTEEFIAKLEDITDKSSTYEIGEFTFSDISPEDIEYLTKGAVFYWSIGSSMRNGQIAKQSIIRFQRLSSWTESDYNEAIDRADDFLNKLNWE